MQNDLHLGELTVRETFDFAARCQGVGHKAGEGLEVLHKSFVFSSHNKVALSLPSSKPHLQGLSTIFYLQEVRLFVPEKQEYKFTIQ